MPTTLFTLHGDGRPEDMIPQGTTDSESQVRVKVVMLHVVAFQEAKYCHRWDSMMRRVVEHVVGDVAADGARKDAEEEGGGEE